MHGHWHHVVIEIGDDPDRAGDDFNDAIGPCGSNTPATGEDATRTAADDTGPAKPARMTRAARWIRCSAHRTGSAPLSHSESSCRVSRPADDRTRNCAPAPQIGIDELGRPQPLIFAFTTARLASPRFYVSDRWEISKNETGSSCQGRKGMAERCRRHV